MKFKDIKLVDANDWDKIVTDTYKRIYHFQQQDECRDRGYFKISIPSEFTNDEEMHDEIPEVINGDIMGVKFKKWLERDPKKPIPNQEYDWELTLFWERNFYPDVYTVANDLHKKGLIDAGEYLIKIDW